MDYNALLDKLSQLDEPAKFEMFIGVIPQQDMKTDLNGYGPLEQLYNYFKRHSVDTITLPLNPETLILSAATPNIDVLLKPLLCSYVLQNIDGDDGDDSH